MKIQRLVNQKIVTITIDDNMVSIYTIDEKKNVHALFIHADTKLDVKVIKEGRIYEWKNQL